MSSSCLKRSIRHIEYTEEKNYFPEHDQNGFSFVLRFVVKGAGKGIDWKVRFDVEQRNEED